MPSLADKYRHITNAQDLIDLGIKPKTSRQMWKIITSYRLAAIRQSILDEIDPAMVGEWNLAFSQKAESENNVDSLEAIISSTPASEPSEYYLRPGVVADEKLGHFVRFKEAYNGKIFDPNQKAWLDDKLFPEGLVGRFINYTEGKWVHLYLDSGVPGFGNRKNFVFPVEQVVDKLEVSSLGQIVPKNLVDEVRKKTLTSFFPYTVLDEKTARKAIVAILMETYLFFFGDPGGGKTELSKDCEHIIRQQEVIFHVKGCDVQCSPYSLIDSEFAMQVTPCPKCLITYDRHGKFKETGFFEAMDPKDIPVVVARFGNGKGVENLEGTVGLQKYHLAGFKIPRTDGSLMDSERQFDPEGFSPGFFSRINNGFGRIDEFEKMRSAIMDCFLTALTDKRIKPDDLRFGYPANFAMAVTANNEEDIPDTINDRMVLIRVAYPTDRDVSYEITRRSYHQERQEAADVEIDDPHVAPSTLLRSTISCPVMIERAIDGFYINLRQGSYKISGINKFVSSNRSKLDAGSASRAELFIDQLFDEKHDSSFVDEVYAKKGIEYAIMSRTKETTGEEYLQFEKDLKVIIDVEFPKVVVEEINTFWCRFYKDELAVKESLLAGITDNANSEIAQYIENPEAISRVHDLFRVQMESSKGKNTDLARLPFEYPFMAYLFSAQPGMMRLKEGRLQDLVGYILKTQERSDCK